MATVEIDHQQVLRKALQNKRPELIQQLNSSTLFLTYLAKFKLIQPGDILKYERMSETRKRNTELVDCILQKDDDVSDGYSKFLEALKKSDQEHLAAMLTNVDKEIDIVDAYQNVLSDHLTEIRKYLKTESRRSEVRFTAPSPESTEVPQKGTDNMNREQITEFLFKVHQLTKNTLVQFERCKQVIDKLHHDCNDVARKNGHMLDKLRESDKLVSDLLQCFGVQHNAIQYHDNTVVGGHAARTKTDESEMLMANMRLNMGMLNDRLEESNSDKTACMEIIDNILQDIYGRKTSLGKYSEPPPKDNRLNKYMHNVKLPPIDNNSSLVARSPNMSYKVAELADNLQSYVHHESQVTHKMNISKFQGAVAHRNFDKVDHDLLHLQKELYRDGNEVATSLIKQIIEATRVEREDCLRMVEDLEKNVANRRQKLMDISSGIKPRKAVQQRKTERSRETNFSQRMTELSKEVKRYMDTEQERGQKSKTGHNKKKLEYDNQLKAITHQMSNMERQLREVTNEKEKYKRLYEQEKMGKPLTRPVIPKRGEKKHNNTLLPPLTSEVSGKKITRGPRLTYEAQSLASLKENIREKRKAALVRPMPRQDEEQRPLSRGSSRTSYSRLK